MLTELLMVFTNSIFRTELVAYTGIYSGFSMKIACKVVLNLIFFSKGFRISHIIQLFNYNSYRFGIEFQICIFVV